MRATPSHRSKGRVPTRQDAYFVHYWCYRVRSGWTPRLYIVSALVCVQALLDAVGLARALTKADTFGGRLPLDKVIKAHEEDMLRRTGPKVEASRDAAATLHSDAATVASNCTRAAAARRQDSGAATTPLPDGIRPPCATAAPPGAACLVEEDGVVPQQPAAAAALPTYE